MTHRAFHRVRITFLKRHVIHTKYLIQLMPLSALWRQASSRLKWAITKERPAARHGHRDATMILVAYRHGLRATELCDLQWHQIELDQGRLHVRRAKRGTPSVHPIRGDEIRALRRLRREHVSEAYVFISEPRRAHEHARLPSPHSKARQDRRDALCGPSAHVAARLRLQAGQ